MIYEIGNKYQEINEKSGVLQNLSVHIAEIIASETIPEVKQRGILLNGGEKISFNVEGEQKIYLRSIRANTEVCIVTQNFKQPASGTGAGCSIDDSITAIDKTWSSKKITDTIGGSGIGGGTSGYAQVTKISVTATPASPKVEEIIIDRTTTFCKAPVEVLKFIPGAQDIVTTVCAFDNTDAGDFTVSVYVEFDGTMHLKTQYDIPVSPPAALADGFISESDELDFSDYKKVEAVV